VTADGGGAPHSPGSPGLDTLLDDAVRWAEEAGRITLDFFGGRLEADAKSDGTPVTKADRAAEGRLRERIHARYPEHGILGEEFGEERPDAELRWILDPIDGTRSFMHGVPLYGVLVGVEVDGVPSVGVAHFPALRETVAAATGRGCTLNGRPCAASRIEGLESALVVTTDVERALSAPIGAGWRTLQRRAAFSRSWGDCYGHVLVATGRADVMVDPILNAWDASPFLAILTEAGGRFTDLSGEATIHGGSGVSTNGLLHAEVLSVLSPE